MVTVGGSFLGLSYKTGMFFEILSLLNACSQTCTQARHGQVIEHDTTGRQLRSSKHACMGVTHNTACRRLQNSRHPRLGNSSQLLYTCVLVNGLSQKQQQPCLCVTKAIHVHNNDNTTAAQPAARPHPWKSKSP